jgi:hypothetical protein
MKNFCFFHILILILLTIAAAASASVGSAIAKEEDRLLPVPFKSAETTEPKSVHRGTTNVDVGEDRLMLPVPVNNAETKIKSGTRTLGEADKAGKASPPNPNFNEGARHRQRQHQCDSMYPFEGSFVYQGGCGGNSFEVKITCENKGRKEERRNGVICNYYEETLVSVCVCII